MSEASTMREFGLTSTTLSDLPLSTDELERITAAEICCDEVLVILERHGCDANENPVLLGLRMLSRLIHDQLTEGIDAGRRETLLKNVQAKLQRAFP